MAVPMVKNRRLKMSPGGMITLPVSARKALAMTKGKGAQLSLALEQGEVVLTVASKALEDALRVSKQGMMRLDGEARMLLARGATRHYWLKLSDDRHEVRLVPYQ